MKIFNRIPLILIIILLAVALAACSVSVDTGGGTGADSTAQAVEQQVATSVAATKAALDTAVASTIVAAVTNTPIPATPTPESEADTPTPAETPTEVTTPEPPTPKPKPIPKVTLLVPTVDVQITVPVVTVPPIVTPVITLPVVTPIVTLPPAIRVCDPPAATSFQQILDANPSLAAELGCPTGIDPNVTPDAWEVQTAFQPFEHGMMIWSNKIGWYEQPVIYVLSENGSYQRYDDTFQDGVDPESGGETPPNGLFEPIRGFGKVWRQNPGVRSALGWATAPEAGGPGRFQIMENGEIIWLSQTNHTYIFRHNNMHWYEFNVPFQP